MYLCGQSRPFYRDGRLQGISKPWDPGCVVCAENWETYRDSDKDPRLKQSYNDQKSRAVMLVNVINLTPFFRTVSGKIAPLKEFSKWLEPYLQCCYDILDGKEPTIDEEMPEEIKRLAKIGVNFLLLKSYDKATFGQQLYSTWQKKMDSIAEHTGNYDEADPFLTPEDYLLCIDRIKLGKAPSGYIEYDTNMKIPKASMNGWEMPELMIDVMTHENTRSLRDLHKYQPENISLEDKAGSFFPLSPDEIEELHAKRNYKLFDIKSGDDEAEVVEEDGGIDVPASQRRGKSLAELRAARNGAESKAVQEFDDDDIPF